MKKSRILIAILIALICMLCIPVFSYATNEELVIIKETENEYIIYLKEYLKTEFEFAFSNDKDSNTDTLTFYDSALDAPEEEANNIAFVDSTTIAMFDNTTYMWIKVNGEIKIVAREIDLDDNITKLRTRSGWKNI